MTDSVVISSLEILGDIVVVGKRGSCGTDLSVVFTVSSISLEVVTLSVESIDFVGCVVYEVWMLSKVVFLTSGPIVCDSV